MISRLKKWLFLFEIGENVEFCNKNAIFCSKLVENINFWREFPVKKKFQKCKCLPVHILVWILNILKVHPEQFFVFAIASLVTEFVDGHSCLVFCYLNKILNYHISHTQFLWRILNQFFHFKLIISQLKKVCLWWYSNPWPLRACQFRLF